MAFIKSVQCTVRIPIFGLTARSFKGKVLSAATGGRISFGSGDVTEIIALNDVSFELQDGERVAIMGHNGSGKSTMLKLISGVYEPTSGSISSSGRIASLTDLTAGMDMEASGYENIEIRGAMFGRSKRQIAHLIDEIGEFSGLGGYLSMPVRTYSSGMLMRLAFSVLTAVNADIVIMDEWLSVGDRDFSERAEEKLKKLVDASRILVIATHSDHIVNTLCNRVIMLEHGSIVSDRRLS